MSNKQKKTAYLVGKVSDHRHRKQFLAVFAVGLLALGVVTYFTLNGSLFAGGQCNGRSGGQLYKDAAEALDKNDNTKLRAVNQTIRAQKNFENDPSCLYPLIVEALDQKDIKKARQYYESMEKEFKNQDDLVDDYKKLGIQNSFMVNRKIEAVEYNLNSPSGAGLMLF